MGVYDGYFEILELEDGIYLELFPAQKGGKAVELIQVIDRLKEKGFSNYKENCIGQALETIDMPKTVKIIDLNNKQAADDEKTNMKFYKIRVSDDKLRVTICFYPTDGEEGEDVVQDIIKELSSLKVETIPEVNAIESLIKDKSYNQDYDLVVGQVAINGKPSKIEYLFKTDKDFVPEIDENGNINYHKLNVVANVKVEQVLAVLHEGDEGVAGKDVFGQVILPIKPKPIKLQFGKNVTISEDKKQLLSKVDGLVKLESEKVLVYETFQVPNNVGNSTGDIEFAGSVVVNGNVLTGFKVEAKGDIEVLGVVEGAEIKAGGNIILHRGIQGMNRAVVSAGGYVQTRFIENAEVISGGYIHSEAILHSNVTAKDEIIVEGKKGMISGGKVSSGKEIKANLLGSHMGTVTAIEVGIDPFLWKEYNDLLKDIPKYMDEESKLEKVIALLNKKKVLEGSLDESKQEMYLSATRNKIFLNNKISMAKKRVEELREQVERRNDGTVVIKNIVYPGVKISIGSSKYIVREELKFVKFFKDGADVKATSA